MVPTSTWLRSFWENVLLPARVDALHHPGGAPRRDDDRATAGAPRREARGDRLVGEHLLELHDVSMAFGGLKVVDDLDLHVDEGEIVSVIGPNGAGKTTPFQPRHGVYVPPGATLRGGEHQGARPAPDHAARDRADVPDAAAALNMTVRENVMSAAYGHTSAGPLRSILRTPGSAGGARDPGVAEERLAFFGERPMGYRDHPPTRSRTRTAEGSRSHAPRRPGHACCCSTSCRQA